MFNSETTPWKSRYVTWEEGLDLQLLLLSTPKPMHRFVALQDMWAASSEEPVGCSRFSRGWRIVN